MVDPLILEWKGPHTFQQVLLNENNAFNAMDVAGVYLWYDPSPETKNRIFYVGRAQGSPTIAQRQLQHYVRQISCSDLIPLHARAPRVKWTYDTKNADVIQAVLDESEVIKIVREGFAFANQIELYYAKVEESLAANYKMKVGKSLIADVERNLIYDLQPSGNSRGMQSRPPRTLEITHVDAGWASEELRSNSREGVRFS